MQIAQSETREQFPLSYRKIMKKTMASTIALAIWLLVVPGVLAFARPALDLEPIGWLGRAIIGIFGLLVVVTLLTYLYQRWYFAVYFYDLTPDFIQIKKGPLTPREITVPYERIQDIYVDQDFLDRIFGLYDVHLSTATVSSGLAAHIDGVEKPAAEGLRAILLETVKERISINRGATTSISNNSIS